MKAGPESRRRKALGFFVTGVAIVALAMAVSACGEETSGGNGVRVDSTVVSAEPETTAIQAPETTTSTSDSGSSTTYTPVGQDATARVYFVHDHRLRATERALPKGESLEKTALLALLDGPSAEEKAAGTTSAIPEKTALLGLSVKDGLAIVDLSKRYESVTDSRSMTMRHAQVVFTLTQFPGIKHVEFRVDGRPMREVESGASTSTIKPKTRALFGEVAPGLVMDSPATGATVGSPVQVAGSAVGGAQVSVSVSLVDLTQGTVLARDSGSFWNTADRAPFQFSLPYDSRSSGKAVTVMVTVVSAQAGGQTLTYVERVPVTLQ